MKFYFDYFYYRVAKFFLKYPTDKGVRAISIISLMQSLIVLSMIEGCLPLFLGKIAIARILSKITWLIVFIVSGSFFFNYLKYPRRYSEFDQHWQNETQTKKIVKGLLIVISFIITFIVYAYVTSWLYRYRSGCTNSF